jgi:hypothetical protein
MRAAQGIRNFSEMSRIPAYTASSAKQRKKGVMEASYATLIGDKG